MKAFILSLFLVVLTSGLFAQRAIVKDMETRQAISNVFVFSQCKSALTHSDGIVNLEGFCLDSTISFQHASYIQQDIIIRNLNTDSIIEILLIPDIFNIKEVVVSASKWNQELREVPIVVDKIDARKAEIYSPQTSADLLSTNSKVFVQKSQLGGGNPMIRGFSANRVLLVVDGVRLNNAIYRAGNLQNVLNIDVNSIENVEVVFGPGSVIYGSDALGGVMSFSTLKPIFTPKKTVNGSGLMRFSSANSERTGNVSIKLSSSKWASVSSISHSYFNDLRMGSVGHPSYDRNFFVRNDGTHDSIVSNRDRNLQVGSAYSQINFLEKISFKPNKNWLFDYNIYFSKLSDVPRYDRLIQIKNDKPKYADWHYGPQQWFMNSLSIANHQKNILYDEAKIIFAYQNYQESRHKRKLDNPILNQQYETINIFSTNIDFYKKLNRNNTLYYGTEGVFNLVGSVANDKNIYTDSQQNAASRYPNGSKYLSTAVYITDKHYLTEKLIANAGLRLNYISVSSVFDTTFYKFPYREANNENMALSGNIGLVYLPNLTSKIALNLSSGFRAPNVDDLSKVFDSGAETVVVPNPNLKPEYVYNIDLTYEKKLWEKLHFIINGFYSYLDNAMIVSDFTFNGKDSILYDGEMSKVKAITNKNFANIYGGLISLDWNFYKNITVKTSANYAKGYDNEGYALRHIAPFFGSTHFIYNNSKLIVDAYSNYNGEISYKDLAQTEREKPHIYESDKEGLPYSPSWETFNLKISYRLNAFFYVAAGVENIFDTRYRPYSSGIAAPGRNFIISLKISSF